MKKICGDIAQGRDENGGFKVYLVNTYAMGGRVYEHGEILSPIASQSLRNHSPCGFSWGYNGSGPAQLALAILLEISGSKDFALKHYQDFKFEIVAILKNKFIVHVDCVEEWIDKRKENQSCQKQHGRNH